MSLTNFKKLSQYFFLLFSFSTCGQALEIAAKMNAKNVLLTHFSQRYAKLPVMKNGAPVAVAFDHMQVSEWFFVSTSG